MKGTSVPRDDPLFPMTCINPPRFAHGTNCPSIGPCVGVPHNTIRFPWRRAGLEDSYQSVTEPSEWCRTSTIVGCRRGGAHVLLLRAERPAPTCWRSSTNLSFGPSARPAAADRLPKMPPAQELLVSAWILSYKRGARSPGRSGQRGSLSCEYSLVLRDHVLAKR